MAQLRQLEITARTQLLLQESEPLAYRLGWGWGVSGSASGDEGLLLLRESEQQADRLGGVLGGAVSQSRQLEIWGCCYGRARDRRRTVLGVAWRGHWDVESQGEQLPQI
eukprot:scaffold1941_cov97-Isochrysis_galbana.AAC.2